jgi:hypothetical protein
MGSLFGGQANKAADAANAAQAAQQKNIQDSIAAINNAYSSPNRQAQYDAYGKNLNSYYTGQVNDQEATNARNLKFALARNGTTGGSAAVDASGQLNKEYVKGLLQASQAAQGGVSALKQSDINAKNQLISLAQQGNYTGSIPIATDQAQDTALAGAANYQNANGLNNLFSGTAGIYNAEQVAAANRKAAQSPIGSIYGGSSSGGSVYGK